MNMQTVFLIELNEINFEYIEKYIEQGKLENFERLIHRHGVIKTESEIEYDHLEPWIQWVTAHTGQTFAEHQVFRLGDINETNLNQIWEFLESRGIRVGAVSPINANNKLNDACFFLPDPWTDTPASGSLLLRQMGRSVAQVVNDNAKSKMKLTSVLWLLMGTMRYARVVNYFDYFSLVMSAAKKKSWAKAQFLDLLLTDIFICESRSKLPQFASLFLNAGAHIQHHYLFNSVVYEGKNKNPDWLIDSSSDPVFDIYDQYDKSLGQIIRSFPNSRLIIATGLHQDPYDEEKYYWRLNDHKSFLQLIGVPFKNVETLMSRDFLVECHSTEEAAKAQHFLEKAESENGTPIFEVDNRGDSLFVMLTYPFEITEDTNIRIGDQVIHDFKSSVAFVAIKNGEHNGIGYLVDTGHEHNKSKDIKLSDLPQMIAASFGFNWSGNSA